MNQEQEEMSKWVKYTSLFGRGYSKEWDREEGLSAWITCVPGDDTKAACRFCKSVGVHCLDLKDHRSTQKHKSNTLPYSATRTLLDTGIKVVTVDNSEKIS